MEAGQLLTLAAAWDLWRAARQVPALQPLRRASLYAIGSLAAYWSFARMAAIFV